MPVTPAVYQQRRQRLLDGLGDGLLVLPTAPEQIRNGDVHQPFRAGSDFHYLTGFAEPEAMLVAWRVGKGRHRAVLFVRPRDKEREIWDGRRAGVAGAKKRCGVDEARPIAQVFPDLPDLLAGQTRVFCTLGVDAEFDRRLFAAFARHVAKHRRTQPPAHPILQDPLPAIAAQRLRKDAHEIDALARAGEVTSAGHAAAMGFARPGRSEREVQAEVEATFRRLGSPREGYSSIVASGPNACILHYHENDRTLRAGELLLLDAGAEIDMYTADITRTFPVSGRFSAPQRAVYAAVLAAQKAAIRAARPGAAWNAPHAAAVRTLTRRLQGLGVLGRGSVRALVDKAAFRPYYMHGTSHWLGLDVHDAGAYQDAAGKPLRLRAGMVLTIEPGLYFGPRDTSVGKELRGIGVRIEDDVLITPRGNRVLTDAAPKEIAAVEAACAAPLRR
jgi:Xaa-Pro aminopeptidase